MHPQENFENFTPELSFPIFSAMVCLKICGEECIFIPNNIFGFGYSVGNGNRNYIGVIYVVYVATVPECQ